MPTILVIDDLEAMTSTAQEGLPDWTVLSAFDGVAGLEMLEQHHKTIDFILLDIQMPRMDGRQALPQIRALYPHIPVRLCSASLDTSDRELAMKLTGRPLIEKPIWSSDLAIEIYHTLGQEAPPPRQEEPLPRQDGEMREQALSKPLRLVICKSDRERTTALINRIRSTELNAAIVQAPSYTVNLFTEQDRLFVVVTFYDDFRDMLLLNAPIMCVCGDVATALQARDQLEEFRRAIGQQTAVAIIVDEPEHPDDAVMIRFALQELLAGRSVLPERV